MSINLFSHIFTLAWHLLRALKGLPYRYEFSGEQMIVLSLAVFAAMLVFYLVWLCRREAGFRKVALCLTLWFGGIGLCAFQTVIGPITVNGAITSLGDNPSFFGGSFGARRIGLARRISPSNPQNWTGADLAGWTASAFTDCSNACEVHVEAGIYSMANQINWPFATNGVAALIFETGAQVTYSGAAYEIEAASSVGTSSANVKIIGGTHILSSSALGGIHLQSFNRGTISGMAIRGATNGPCIFNEGANSIDYLFNNLNGCKDGIQEVGKVVSATNYSPNANRVIGGQITGMSRWGYWQNSALAATVGLALNDSIIGVNFGSNGTNSTASGHVSIDDCASCNISKSYFEYTGGSNVTASVVVGLNSANINNVQGLTIEGNLFLDQSTNAEAVNVVLAQGTKIHDNVEDGNPPNVINYNTNSRNGVIGATLCLACSGNHVVGTDTSETEVHEVGTNWLNALAPTIRGYGFNEISGLDHDLAIESQTGTNIVRFNDNTGVQKAFITNAGLGQFNGGVNVGGGSNMSLYQTYATASITPTAITAATCSDQTFTVSGLIVNDRISQVVPPSALGNVSLNAYPSAANTVLFHFCNESAVGVTPPAGVYSFAAFH